MANLQNTFKTAYQQGQTARENGWERVSPYTKNVAEGYWYAGFDGIDYKTFASNRKKIRQFHCKIHKV